MQGCCPLGRRRLPSSRLPSTLQWLQLLAFLVVAFAFTIVESLLCGPLKEIYLQPKGRTSAISLTLSNDGTNAENEPCTLSIYAPNVYALSLKLIDVENPFVDFGKLAPQKWNGKRKSDKTSIADKKNRTNPDCLLNIFYIDEDESADIPVWKTTPCSPEFSLRKSLPQLMSPPIKIEWWPPVWPKRTDHLRLVVTAVNSGETCLANDQITCLRAGLELLLCVSDALACDGVKHCPAESGGDEDSALCMSQHTSWMEELIKRLASKHGELLGIDMITNRPINATTSKGRVEVMKDGKPRKRQSALDAALEPYGTWGYLMLGMLICATVLIIFGVWECFCHYSRPNQDHGMPPDCVAPAAIICASSPQHWRPYPPPTYDELEPPPPSYNILFPHSNKVGEPGELPQSSSASESNAEVDVISTSIDSVTNVSTSNANSATVVDSRSSNTSNAIDT